MINLEEERDIKPEERTLIEYLVSQAKDKPAGLAIPNRVFTMKDGGMGSIKFKNDNAHLYQRDLITADYWDSDGIPILISLDLNTADELYELDFFKGDYSTLIVYPTPEKLFIRR